LQVQVQVQELELRLALERKEATLLAVLLQRLFAAQGQGR
jgi:hypothetical protein